MTNGALALLGTYIRVAIIDAGLDNGRRWAVWRPNKWGISARVNFGGHTVLDIIQDGERSAVWMCVSGAEMRAVGIDTSASRPLPEELLRMVPGTFKRGAPDQTVVELELAHALDLVADGWLGRAAGAYNAMIARRFKGCPYPTDPELVQAALAAATPPPAAP